MKITDNFLKKVEKKTNVSKDTIFDLAKSLQGDNMKNESALRDVVQKLSLITGKTVPKEKEDKIVKAILDDKVPDVEKMI